jgi:GxxExxY protein
MKLDDITYTIRGAVFEVNKLLGHGFLEKVYENALITELRLKGLKTESQVPLKVFYKDNMVGEYFADIIMVNIRPGRPDIVCVCLRGSAANLGN